MKTNHENTQGRENRKRTIALWIANILTYLICATLIIFLFVKIAYPYPNAQYIKDCKVALEYMKNADFDKLETIGIIGEVRDNSIIVGSVKQNYADIYSYAYSLDTKEEGLKIEKVGFIAILTFVAIIFGGITYAICLCVFFAVSEVITNKIRKKPVA